MFVLAELVDTVRIEPHRFGHSFYETLEQILNRKFANKIVLNVGLCICFYDFVKLSESYILPGDGATHTKVNFHYVVFRPFIDEILLGKIRSCNREGLIVSLGFFDDVFVPAAKLPENTTFNDADQMWVWNFESSELFMEPGREVRCRVVEEEFCDTVPVGVSSETTAGSDEPSTSVASNEKKHSYSITASMSESGLGCIEWWLD